MAVERISVDLDPVLAQRIRDAAARRGLSLRAAFTEGMELWLLDSPQMEPELLKVLEAIRDYQPQEVAKDDFAYDRMVENYRDAARRGIAKARGEWSGEGVRAGMEPQEAQSDG